ncbi:hypothetical protein NPIL_18661, partial [Nephila pilipes]
MLREEWNHNRSVGNWQRINLAVAQIGDWLSEGRQILPLPFWVIQSWNDYGQSFSEVEVLVIR